MEKKLEVTRNLVFGETYSVKLANGKTLKVDTNLDKNLVVKSGQTIFRKILQEFEQCTTKSGIPPFFKKIINSF